MATNDSDTSEANQSILVPDLEAWRIIDLVDGSATALDGSHNLKQGVAIADESDLWSRLKRAFEYNPETVRGVVLPNNGKYLIVEMKVVERGEE